MKIITKISIVFLIILSGNIFAQPSHSSWNKLLQMAVSAKGEVDYKMLKENRSQLNSYLEIIQQELPNPDLNKEDIMVYWINAYNAFTVELILDNPDIKSIMEINNGKAWDLDFIEIGGKMFSLNNIENDILRKKYKEPRIHFALNCAAKSCPKLNNKAFTAQNLELELDRLAKEFVNNSSKNKLAENAVKISKIFDWYKVDFDENIVKYLNQYSSLKINETAKVSYQEYDWSLNSKK